MDKDRLINILNKFKNKKIAVLGDVMLDLFTYGVIDRVNPEQPSAPLVRVHDDKYVLGGASNVANNLTSLDAEVDLFGVMNFKSLEYHTFVEECAKHNINLIPFNDQGPIIIKHRIIAHGQQITRIDREETYAPSAEVVSNILETLGESTYDGVILSDYNKGFFSESLSQSIIQLCKSKNIATFVDPKPTNWQYFKGCDVVAPNLKEAREITDRHEIGDVCKSLLEKTEAKYVLVTCSEKGMVIYDGKRLYKAHTEQKETWSVAGAGDTVISLMALARISGASYDEAMQIANLGASIVIDKVGTATTNKTELMNKYGGDYE